jgi:hypothetical protein
MIPQGYGCSPHEKARELLKSCLTPEQLTEYRAYNRFTVTTNKGHKYRISCYSIYQNVQRLRKDGSATAYGPLCGYLKGVPEADVHLAQKLMLEACESLFLRRAFPSCIFWWGRRIIPVVAAILLTAMYFRR